MEPKLSKNSKAIVAVFETHKDAEIAIKELDRLGFNMKNLSIIGQGYQAEERVLGYVKTKDRLIIWGKKGAFWGMLTGLLAGSAFLFVPGLGHILVFGPLVNWLTGGALLGGGLSVIGGALRSLGIPKDSVLKYERAIKSDHYLLVAYDRKEIVEEAQGLLETTAALAETHELNGK